MLYIWSVFVRASHWLLVAAFTVAFLTHDSEWTRLTHVNAGYVAGILLLVRIVWGFMASGYANFATFPFNPRAGFRYAVQALSGHAKRYIGHNPAGSLVIYCMLATGLLTVISGLLVYNDAEFNISGEYLDTLHGVCSWAWLVLVVSHVLGVIFESILHRENLVMSMITGYKKTEASHTTAPASHVTREGNHVQD